MDSAGPDALTGLFAIVVESLQLAAGCGTLRVDGVAARLANNAFKCDAADHFLIGASLAEVVVVGLFV